LIIHRVSASSCSTRQLCNYHKCHRCIYRGQAEDWEPDADRRVGREQNPVLPMTARALPDMPVRDKPEKQVELPAPAAEQQSANGSLSRRLTLESSSV